MSDNSGADVDTPESLGDILTQSPGKPGNVHRRMRKSEYMFTVTYCKKINNGYAKCPYVNGDCRKCKKDGWFDGVSP